MLRERTYGHATRLLGYMRAFGAATGARLLARTLLPVERVELQVPGYPAPILLRPRTSDVRSFGQIFGGGAYQIDLGPPEPNAIVDAGANVGYSAVYLARRFPRARILALEPERENFELLVDNTRAWPQIIPLRKALWSTPGRLQIENPEDEAWAFRMRAVAAEESAGDTVDAVTMPEVFDLLGVERLDLLKLDIEGAERELFGPGCEAWVPRVRAFAIELHDRIAPGCAQAFYRALAGLDYTQVTQGETTFVVPRP